MSGESRRSMIRFSFALISLAVASAAWARQADNIQLGKQAFADGHYVQSERYFRAAVVQVEARGSDQEKANAFSSLAAVLLTQGSLSEAEGLFTRALQI